MLRNEIHGNATEIYRDSLAGDANRRLESAWVDFCGGRNGDALQVFAAVERQFSDFSQL